MTGDALSDLLRTVRLTGAMFFDVAAAEPWVAEQPPAELILPRILPGAERLISYHVVIEGRCFATLLGDEPIALEAGEVIVITNGDPHVMSSSPGMRAGPVTPDAIAAASAGPLPFFVRYGSGGAPSARLVCGFLACDARPFNPLLDNLPAVMTARVSSEDPGSWLAPFIQLAVTESANRRAGSESVLAKLSELMFVEVVRRYLATMPPERAGWLAGLRDPYVGKALSLMHGSPAHEWTIGELGKKVGLSRSVLAERFTDLLGMPPMQYLARWRMQIAARILCDASTDIAAIAEQIGYESEAAFSRAFKKLVGVPPSVWRRRARPIPTP
ncbi:MAG TPA: AraC family transcriptional regulator [Steroidobacteraceae bacterium]|jgi:AraC-like DNA-binding protein|nr:AraC family transcriptional regulator [Steroidobacteraceae bacterium]